MSNFELAGLGRKLRLDCRHVHLQLSLLSRELNKIFSVQLTLEMASLFAVLAELFIEFHNMYADKDTDTLYQFLLHLSIYVWAIVFAIKLLALNHICQTVCDKAIKSYLSTSVHHLQQNLIFAQNV